MIPSPTARPVLINDLPSEWQVVIRASHQLYFGEILGLEIVAGLPRPVFDMETSCLIENLSKSNSPFDASHPISPEWHRLMTYCKGKTITLSKICVQNRTPIRICERQKQRSIPK